MSSSAKVLNGAKVIVAIVGGTMLTIALTRPRLRWLEQLTEGSDRARRLSERALTALSFVMCGYAALTVLAALHKQLDTETSALLRGAAGFPAIYALLVNFEPFVHEWRLRGGLPTCLLYGSLATFWLVVGATAAELAADSKVSPAGIKLLTETGGLSCMAWGLYRLWNPAGERLERWIPVLRAPDHDTPTPDEAP